jgi:2-keto-4-pentenoate hydratase/2-oxohepta-3-ene-1,7-dioic acid hydratase in catechol pathway
MKLLSYLQDGSACVGRLLEDGQTVRPFEMPADEAPNAMLSLIDRWSDGARPQSSRAGDVALSEIVLMAPIPRPRRNLFCVGRNYRAHANELSQSIFKANSAAVDAWPIVFSKVPECVIGPRDDVVLPTQVSTQIDYEAELTIVIGRRGRNIAAADAEAYIFGYTIVNDVTARDVQSRHQQWDLGKSFDTFCPMGPFIVTKEGLDGADTRVRCWVNDEPRQDASTRDLIFDIPTLIETCSRGITLYPGDLIATGTPAGVGMGFTPPRYLKHGDVVRISIDGIGTIENRFVAGEA